MKYQKHRFNESSQNSLIPPLQKTGATTMTVRLEEINDEVVKAPETEVIVLFNPL
jgi:hypothetical protein